MERYYYTLMEGTYVVRQSHSKDVAEYLTPEGEWIDYPDPCDGVTNGRSIASEEEALETAKEIFRRRPEWWARQSHMRQGDKAYRRGDHGEVEKGGTAGPEFGAAAVRMTDGLKQQAMHYEAQGKYAEAEPLYARALAIEETTLGSEHPDVSQSLRNYAALLQKMGRTAEAVKMEARAAAVLKP